MVIIGTFIIRTYLSVFNFSKKFTVNLIGNEDLTLEMLTF